MLFFACFVSEHGGRKMSSIVTLCRRFGMILQASWPRSVRTLCQVISRGEVLPSDKSFGADNEHPEVKNHTADTSSASHSEADAAKIIQLINTVSETNLSALKHVSSNVASRVASYRAANGPFVSVTDILRVPGIGQQTLQRICKGIVQPSLQVQMGKNNGSYIGAEQVGVAPSRIESLKDVVAVDIGLKHLSWVYMTRDRQVWQWKVKDIVGITAGKWDPPSFHRVITSTISEMPKPDFYVMEHQSYTNANKGTYQMLLFQRTLQSMLYAALNHDREDTGTQRAISMPQTQVGRHFELQVKGTRMSGQEIVANLLRDRMESADDADLPARLSWEDADIFHAATKHQKEHLSNCLLQAIAFYDLIVDRNGGS